MFKTTKVAVIFDFDKTLSPSYMQKVIFDEYRVDENSFWDACLKRSQENKALLGHTHGELDFMNMIIQYTHQGIFKGLNNKKLAQLGQNIQLYPGVPWIMNELFCMGVEIYIVSSGIKIMLSSLEDRIRIISGNPEFHFTRIYGGDFRDGENGVNELSSIANCISPTDKIRAIYEISKGCHVYGFDVSTSIPIGGRRTPLESMVYVGDGPSDIMAMNFLHDSGGYTLGVFNPAEPAQFEQIEMIREDHRLDMVAVADYSEETTAAMWLLGKARELLYKSSEEYELRQKIKDLQDRRVGFVHPWSASKYKSTTK
jgi:2-hydroxy-3-keto-5-methylthiopentenyl-1-phosphate phosphatase